MNKKLLTSLFISFSIMFGSTMPVLGAPAPQVIPTNTQGPTTIFHGPGDSRDFIYYQLSHHGYPMENVQYNCTRIIKDFTSTRYLLDIKINGGEVIQGCITVTCYERGPVFIDGMSAEQVIELVSIS